MHDDATLTAALERIAPSAFSGYTYRIIDDEFRTDPLSGIGSVIRGGRYNAPRRFEALYSSDSRITALYEIAALFGDVDVPHSPELMLTLEVRLSRVLDLTDNALRDALGATEDELVAPYLQDQLLSGEAPTQRLGRLAFDSNQFSALRVPSAARPAATNFVIFPARFASNEQVRLYDERGRWRQIRVGPPA
ncbi:MAG: RES family NAD+ phosphorylase [Candidatus Baltobacteraceae bacterium]